MRPFLIALNLFLLVPLACSSGSREARPTQQVRIALTANTRPDTAYREVPDKVIETFKAIRVSYPDLIIHLGDLFHGGSGWMGVRPEDIRTQLKSLNLESLKGGIPFHIAPGPMDLYQNSGEILTELTGRELYYSFNVGRRHFIILDTASGYPEISRAQQHWLEADLEAHRDFDGIFIFAHHPLQSDYRGIATISQGDTLHTLFTDYPVKAVITRSPLDRDFSKDTLRYILRRYGAFRESEKFHRYHQYSILTIGSGITIEDYSVK